MIFKIYKLNPLVIKKIVPINSTQTVGNDILSIFYLIKAMNAGVYLYNYQFEIHIL